MIIVIIILSIICALLTAALIFYRREIARIARQTAFVNKNKTNMKLTGNIGLYEINELIDELNILLEQKEKAEKEYCSRENNIKETIANLSHDIRTPLTSLDGYFQLLGTDISEDEREKYTEVIRSRIKSLSDILEQLFTYTKIQDNSFEAELSGVDLSGMLSEVILSFYNEFQNKHPCIDIPEQPVIITANAEMLRRVLENVIRNSLLHGEDTEISLKTTGGKAIFTCSNTVKNAMDIDAEHVFDRFYKADKARHDGGSGLGLAIAKELTDKMNGDISSRIADGRFIITASFDIYNV